MPTEVSPAPFRYSQQYPISLEHPAAFNKMFGGYGQSGSPARQMNMGLHQYQHLPHASLSATGHHSPGSLHPSYLAGPQQQHPHALMPMRIPPPPQDGIPNSVLPNGTRNPWAAYAGETYMPSSEKADRMSLDTGGSPLVPAASLRSSLGPGSAPIPIPVPRSVVTSSGWAGASMSGSGSGSYTAGRRMDEGWDGSQGRAHMGHLPDPGSTAGRIGRAPTSGIGVQGWRAMPSSWQNHARLTPGLVPPVAPSGLSRSHPNQGGGMEYLAPRSAERPPRRASFAVPPEKCSACSGSPRGPGPRGAEPGAGGLKRSGSERINGDGAGDRQRRGSSAAYSPAVNSPLGRVAKLPDGEGGLKRSASSSSRHSSRRG